MPSFSQNSTNKLNTCHSDLQTVFNEVIKWFDCTIVCGHRGEAEQNEAYNNGFSQIKWPKGKHNTIPSMAVDVVPYPIDWKDTARMKFFIGFVLGIARMMKESGEISHDIVSGIDWDSDTVIKDHTFHDHPHFELR